MKKTTVILTLLIICAVLFPSCGNGHGNYPFIYNGKKCEVVKERKTWTDAAMYATDRGAHLIEITDSAKQKAVYNAIIHGAGISPTYTEVRDGGGVAYIWIGATDRNHEGVWRWDGNNSGQGQNFWNGEGAHGKGNGTPVNNAYTNWGGTATGKPNEPDNSNGNQNAAAIGLADWPKGTGTLGHAGEWNDIDENNQLYFVIEYDK